MSLLTRGIWRSALVALVMLATVLGRSLSAQAAEPVVHAVLFYSETCEHCKEVMEKYLPPLVNKYEGQLDIVGVDVNHEVGQNLYQAMLNAYNVPDERIGVPTLVVGDQVLVGSVEIPEMLPGIIESGLAAGGIDFPTIPGLSTILAAQASAPAAAPQPQSDYPIWMVKFMGDPVANSIAVLVLLVMVAAVIYVLAKFLGSGQGRLLNWPSWWIPVFALIGTGIALYMSYIEVSKTEAVCGPVGNCNAVQSSAYASLFGFLPVGVLGLMGYGLILIAWATREYGPASLRRAGTLALWALAWFGILFMIYLTSLEPFVIGASCVWCLTTALIMTTLFLASSGQAISALKVADDDDYDNDEDYEDEPVKA